jgi:glycosyltransferase involved in cell wall biosynthesis
VTLISVVIPTRDRAGVLGDCLETLRGQDIEPDSLEVVVLDDGSSCDLRPLVQAASSDRVPMRLERQRPAGLNPARNRGAQVARGPVVAYLDDDVLVSAGWARAIRDSFERDEWDALAGAIELKLEGPEPPWLTADLRTFLAELDLGPRARWLADEAGPFGANCAVRRSTVLDLGGFRPDLDRQGTALVSNGEIEFFQRLRRAGGRVAYAPDAHVLHRVPRDRLTLDWFKRRAFAQGVSDELMRGPARGPEWGRRLLREALRTARAGPIMLRRLGRSQATVNANIWLAYCEGRRNTLRELRLR